MRLVFVNWAHETHGSAQDIHNYTQVARALGHEVVLYGPSRAGSAFNYSMDVGSADAVVFIFEFTTRLEQSEKLSFLRLVGTVPRHRRIVIDCDGKYNEAINVVGDINHPDAAASRDWLDICDSLSDKIVQPTFHPLRPNVRPFFFHAYNPAWEAPLGFDAKPFGMVYVGNNWFRWRALRRVLDAVGPIRPQLGRIGLVGHGWDATAPWGGPTPSEDAYYAEPEYLKRLNVEVLPPVRFDRVMECMGQGICSPVIYRPLFDRLRLVTCRTFETPAANTIPLFAQDEAYLTEIYGKEAVELMLPDEEPHEKIADVLHRPDHYASIVSRIRCHLAQNYSYVARVRELVEIVGN
jgi:Glycosyl transferases group 1